MRTGRPDTSQWFARPLHDAGPEWGHDGSFLIDSTDVDLVDTEWDEKRPVGVK